MSSKNFPKGDEYSIHPCDADLDIYQLVHNEVATSVDRHKFAYVPLRGTITGIVRHEKKSKIQVASFCVDSGGGLTSQGIDSYDNFIEENLEGYTFDYFKGEAIFNWKQKPTSISFDYEYAMETDAQKPSPSKKDFYPWQYIQGEECKDVWVHKFEHTPICPGTLTVIIRKNTNSYFVDVNEDGLFVPRNGSVDFWKSAIMSYKIDLEKGKIEFSWKDAPNSIAFNYEYAIEIPQDKKKDDTFALQILAKENNFSLKRLDDGEVKMTKEQMIDLLNKDLVGEYKHMLFYLHASIVVKGLHREELSEFFEKSAKDEMAHVRQFGNVIQGLGGVPQNLSHMHIEFPEVSQPREILAYALQMEEEVVENYVTRAKQAENDLGGTDGFFIHCFLEDQILDSRTDADHIKEMLKAVCPASTVQQ